MKRSKTGSIALVGLALAPLATGAAAQPYPQRAVRLVVPFAPGGSSDVLSRIVAQHLNDALGQPIIVDNRPAGGGLMGSELVAKAQPDGHTILLGSLATMVAAPSSAAKPPYDPRRDFAHIGLWVTFPLALVVPANSPITSLKELIAQAKARPGQLRFGAQGLGTSSHLFVELLHHKAGIKTSVVPYKGGAPALTGVLTGEVDYAMVAVATAQSQVAAGRVKALGVTSSKPAASLPGALPIASVAPGYDGLNFHGVHAPAKTPSAIVARLNAETNRILQRPDVVERLRGFDMDLPLGSPQHYRDFVDSQLQQWIPVIKAAGMRNE